MVSTKGAYNWFFLKLSFRYFQTLGVYNMIELALSMIDYLVRFFQERENNVDEFFERYVSPAYEAAEEVFNDYSMLLTEVKKKIESLDDPKDLIQFLEQGRVKYLAVRMRLRAEISSRFGPDMYKLPDFERGILGILMGGLATFEDERFNVTPYDTLPYRGSHTLLDLLYRLSSLSSIGATRSDYLGIVNRQMQVLNEAWSDVVKGYAQYKKLVAPTPQTKHLKNLH